MTSESDNEPATLGQKNALRKKGVADKYLNTMTAAEAHAIFDGKRCLPGSRKKLKVSAVSRWSRGQIG